MIQLIETFVQRHRTRGAILDSNLLLLLVVGRVDRALIGRFKRTREFREGEFDLVAGLAGSFSRLFSTPNILTEVSNLGGQLGGPDRPSFFQVLGRTIEKLEESYIESRRAASTPAFERLGLADSTTSLLAQQGIGVVSGDFHLVGSLRAAGVDALNFNHVRTATWGD